MNSQGIIALLLFNIYMISGAPSHQKHETQHIDGERYYIPSRDDSANTDQLQDTKHARDTVATEHLANSIRSSKLNEKEDGRHANSEQKNSEPVSSFRESKLGVSSAETGQSRVLIERIRARIEGVSYPEVWSRSMLEDEENMWKYFWLSVYTDTLTSKQTDLLCAILCEYVGQCPPECPGYYDPPWGGDDGSFPALGITTPD